MLIPRLTSAIAKQIYQVEESPEEQYKLPDAQPGAQADFYNSEADITLFGGAAGSGKTSALLLKAAKYVSNPEYGSVLFRRTAPEITTEGGLWDESVKVYSQIPGVRSRESKLDWIFPSGACISFGHAQYEKDIENKYPGSQICHCGWDELTKFTARQFWFMLSRNRSTSGIKPRIDATCNPDADSWVKDLIMWWLDDKGFPDKSKSGKLRYFYRVSEQMYWGDTAEELMEQMPDMAAIAPPKSLTFIPGTIYDNPALLKTNPQYLSNLLSLNPVEKARLLDGNWFIRDTQDSLFPNTAIAQSLSGQWLQPTKNRIYIAGIDPNFGGKDYFTCHIYDVTDKPYKLVAEYHENERTTTYSLNRAIALLTSYNVLACAIEKNSGGAVVAEKLTEKMPGLNISTITTNQQNKRINTDRIALLLEQNLLVFPSDWIGISEFRNFSLKERRAIAGHDDQVMACAIAFTLLEIIDDLRPSGDGLAFTTQRTWRTRLY